MCSRESQYVTALMQRKYRLCVFAMSHIRGGGGEGGEAREKACVFDDACVDSWIVGGYD